MKTDFDKYKSNDNFKKYESLNDGVKFWDMIINQKYLNLQLLRH